MTKDIGDGSWIFLSSLVVAAS